MNGQSSNLAKVIVTSNEITEKNYEKIAMLIFDSLFPVFLHCLQSPTDSTEHRYPYRKQF